MKHLMFFFTCCMFILTACNHTATGPVNTLDTINADNALTIFAELDTLQRVRNNPGLGLEEGLVMTDSIPVGQVTDPLSEFVWNDETGQTILKFHGDTIFQNSWNYNYMTSAKPKTDVRFRHQGNFSAITLRNNSLDNGIGHTEIRVWFIARDSLRVIDVASIAAPGYTVGAIRSAAIYKDCLFLDIANGWARNPGPQELVVYSMQTGEFKKFPFY